MAEPSEGGSGGGQDQPDVYQIRDLFERFRQQKDRILQHSILSDIGKVKKILRDYRESITKMEKEKKLIAAKLRIEQDDAATSRVPLLPHLLQNTVE